MAASSSGRDVPSSRAGPTSPRRRRRDDAPASRDEEAPLPELDAATLSRLAEEVSPLPPALRDAAYEALSSMEAAGRAEDTRNS